MRLTTQELLLSWGVLQAQGWWPSVILTSTTSACHHGVTKPPGIPKPLFVHLRTTVSCLSLAVSPRLNGLKYMLLLCRQVHFYVSEGSGVLILYDVPRILFFDDQLDNNRVLGLSLGYIEPVYLV